MLQTFHCRWCYRCKVRIQDRRTIWCGLAPPGSRLSGNAEVMDWHRIMMYLPNLRLEWMQATETR